MTITYETLFEILRREKNQDDLQKLNDNFFQEVKEYVEDKNKILSEKPRLDQFFDESNENEQNAIRIQLQNIRKIIKDVFERRERKVIDMAINKAKTGSTIIDTTSLLPGEREFFESQVKVIGGFRSEILDATLLLRTSRGQEEHKAKVEPKELNIESSEPNNTAFKKVYVIDQVPKFVGVDLEIYGPFDASEEVELSPEIADMLIKTNKAKAVE